MAIEVARRRLHHFKEKVIEYRLFGLSSMPSMGVWGHTIVYQAGCESLPRLVA
jgi:hypothetical protein